MDYVGILAFHLLEQSLPVKVLGVPLELLSELLHELLQFLVSIIHVVVLAVPLDPVVLILQCSRSLGALMFAVLQHDSGAEADQR